MICGQIFFKPNCLRPQIIIDVWFGELSTNRKMMNSSLILLQQGNFGSHSDLVIMVIALFLPLVLFSIQHSFCCYYSLPSQKGFSQCNAFCTLRQVANFSALFTKWSHSSQVALALLFHCLFHGLFERNKKEEVKAAGSGHSC